MLVTDGNRDVAAQPGQAGGRGHRGKLSRAARVVVAPSCPAPACLPPFGRAELCRHGIPGEEVVRRIRHQGDPAAVDRSAVVLPSTAGALTGHAFTEGEGHQDRRLPRTVGPHQRHHFTAVQGQGGIPHQRGALAVHLKVRGGQDGHLPGCRRRRRCLSRTGAGGDGRGTGHQGAVVDGPPRVRDGDQRFRPVLRHDDADTGVAGQGVEDGDDAGSRRRIKVGQGLVHQEQRGLLHHGGGDGHERCLTGGEGADGAVQQGRHADPLGDRPDLRLRGS